MKTFPIKITEILSRTVLVNAESLNDAIEKASALIADCSIILDADDYCGRMIEEDEGISNANGSIKETVNTDIFEKY